MVSDEVAGQRLDRAVATWLPGLSRSRAKTLIEGDRVTLRAPGGAGATMADASRKVKAGEAYDVDVPESAPAIPLPEAIALVVLHEDDDLIVIDKPAGMVVHPAPGHDSGTLVNALLAHCGASLSGIGGVRRPGIVHRLDKDTSGVMVAAKNDRAHHALSRQFADHSIERAYGALVHGSPMPPAGLIETQIGRSPTDRQRMAVLKAGGRHAATRFKVLESFAGPRGTAIASLVHCELLTGRTHQVRVHLAHLGHPVVGDPVYARGRGARTTALPDVARAFPRQALHARRLAFDHPRTRERLTFDSNFPNDISELIRALRALV
ncbi:MAG: RluA family pseudouridine synthase [Rhodospirillales bacterium]|nr:RluA family pseudouridine synthase [Rhodospirillales bacterium]